jgi:LPXTG-site transpeptidase (sortase) family protein
MQNRTKRWGPLFLAAFTFLSLATIALLVISVLFLTSAPVRIYAEDWARAVFAAEQPVEVALDQPSAPRVVRVEQRPNAGDLSAEAEEIGENPQAGDESSGVPIGDLLINDPSPEEIEREARMKKPAGPKGELVIPNLKVDTRPQWVFVKDGVWDIETLDKRVGWLQTTGTHPEDDLAMVFIGHITLPYPGGAGPFLYLSELKAGAEIHYRTAETLYVYEVEERAILPPSAIEQVYVREKDKLVLITCTSYNAVTRSYDSRLFVQAALVRTEPLQTNSLTSR